MNPAIDAPKRPALRYYGGKWKLAPWIISHFPEHKNYVEPCGGAASVLLQKPRSPLETYNDLDGNVVNFFRVLRDKPDELIRKIKLTPWAREEYELAITDMEGGDDVEQARRFFVMSWQTVAGNPNSGWKTNKHSDDRFPGTLPADYNLVISDALRDIADRLLTVQFDKDDALTVIKKHDHIDTLFYFDPPYVESTRGSTNQYLVDWSGENLHTNAADLLRTCVGFVVVSGYACPLYADLYERHGWQRVDTMAQTNSGGKRVESLWLSPRTVEALAMPAQVGLFELAA